MARTRLPAWQLKSCRVMKTWSRWGASGHGIMALLVGIERGFIEP
jgi:hypothetical protein